MRRSSTEPCRYDGWVKVPLLLVLPPEGRESRQPPGFFFVYLTGNIYFWLCMGLYQHIPAFGDLREFFGNGFKYFYQGGVKRGAGSPDDLVCRFSGGQRLFIGAV